MLYSKRDVWFPKLEGIGSRFQSVKSNGELAEGNFPLSISGGIDYQTGNLNGYLAILSDAYLYIYNDNGELYEERTARLFKRYASDCRKKSDGI